jgi:hypothetical protein
VVTFIYSLCVTGVEIYFRNYRRIAETRFEGALEDPAAEPVAKSFRLVDRIRRVLLQCEPLVLVALVLPFRWQPTANEMRSLVGEFVRRTAEECGNATRLFTDGAMDAGVEVAAAVQGKLLRTLSMMSGGEPREVYIRERDALDAEDKDLLATGASDALRTWVRYRPERMADVAIQLGFELWRHDKLPMPACGGFIARPDGGLSSETAAAGVAAAHALAALARQPVTPEVRALYPNEKLEFGTGYIIPKPFDRRLFVEVSHAVAAAAVRTGVAQKPVNLDAYRQELVARAANLG